MPKKAKLTRQQQRSMRTQQVILGIIGVIVVLSMVISLIAR
jgi:hypothetical protein